ncbi:hypothetical protein QYE76_032350 [Lolium multiflorum]|uniref:C2H2-type domain-containing protein n=1 Tax=Lolium multiflorum TaxID=4521 RepID=A0AAD8QTX3_LOLMU|nr:hypothetical protein QYE76_032350 [Lolium multiflorum]
MESRSTKEPQQQQPWSYCSFAASIAWPPRSYPCSFCEREFRSAQALGGHMNVHRRDRARLRQGSPPPPPPPRPAAAGSVNPRWAAAAIPNLNYPPPPPPSQPSLYHTGGRSYECNERSSVAASAKAKGLELGVGAGVHCCVEEEKEDGLDLELRLGWS